MTNPRRAAINAEINKRIWFSRLRSLRFVAMFICIPIAIIGSVFLISNGISTKDKGPWIDGPEVEGTALRRGKVITRQGAGDYTYHSVKPSGLIVQLDDGEVFLKKYIPLHAGEHVLLRTQKSLETGNIRYSFKCYVAVCKQ